MSALDRQASADELERRQRELDEHSEIIRKKEEDQKQYPVPTYLKKAFESGKVNVAITGASGAGKSSISNLIRGTTNSKNPNHAKTGIKESTVEPTQYEYTAQLGRVLENFGRYITDVFNAKQDEVPQVPHEKILETSVHSGDILILKDSNDEVEVLNVERDSIEVKLKKDDKTQIVNASKVESIVSPFSRKASLWDLPGAGTEKFPAETYVKNMGMRYYDIVLLVTAERFTEGDVKVKKELDHWKIPYFIIRNKIDQAIQSNIDQAQEDKEEGDEEELSNDEKKEIEEETISELRNYFKNECGMPEIYMVSSKKRGSFDFKQLMADVENALKQVRAVHQEKMNPDLEGWFEID
jgi:predicted GTPase